MDFDLKYVLVAVAGAMLFITLSVTTAFPINSFTPFAPRPSGKAGRGAEGNKCMAETKEISLRSDKQLMFSPEDIETIKNTVAKDATDTELKLFLIQCKRTGLDPFSRQIYFLKMGGKASIQSSIDGFRLIAERSSKYRGQTIPVFLDKAGKCHEVWTQAGYPVAAKVGVHRADFKEPLYGIAKWDSYVPMYNGKVGTMWAKMPDLMLAKVAEALALRKAFPNDLSGIYASEEMTQADRGEAAGYDTAEVPDNAPVTSTGDDTPGIEGGINSHSHVPPTSIEHEGRVVYMGQEIPTEVAAQKQMIVAKAKKKWPNLDIKDAKAIKTAIADYTELELVEANYPAIIRALS